VNNHKTKEIIGLAMIAASLLSAGVILSLQYSLSANAQNQKTNQSQSQSNKTNSSPPIGNTQQLTKALGNNSKTLANNTNIGNPNAGKAASAQQKITSGTPANGLQSNPTNGSQKTTASGGSGQNKTGGTSNMTNMTAGIAKSAGTANSSKK
jgi:hypothetical protein